MADFKESWKSTGTGLGHAFRELGKTLINTGKKGVDKAVDWAGNDNSAQPAQQPAQQPVQQPMQQPVNQPIQQPVPQPAPVQTEENPDVAEEIRKLAQLKDEGIITEEEFTSRKRMLLGI